MKITISIFLYCAFAIGVLAGDNTKQMTKNVDAPADLPKEVAAYYNNLVEKDEDVQKQVARLTGRSREKAGGLFKLAEEPRAFEWFPMSETRSDNGDTAHGRFLVVQTAGRWRTKDSDADIALVAEFNVDYDETNPSGHKLTIAFLGFRKFIITPATGAK